MDSGFEAILQKLSTGQYYLDNDRNAVVTRNNGFSIYRSDQGKFLPVNDQLCESYKEQIRNAFEQVVSLQRAENKLPTTRNNHTVSPVKSPYETSVKDNELPAYKNQRLTISEVETENWLRNTAFDQDNLQQTVFKLAQDNDWENVASLLENLEIGRLQTEVHGHLIHMAAARPDAAAVLIRLANLEGLVDLPDRDGHTPVEIVIMSRFSADTIKNLVLAGANPEQVNTCKTDKSLLHLAIELNACEIVNWLIRDYPHLIQQKDCHGDYPLHTAVKAGNVELCRKLQPCEEMINTANNNGYTPKYIGQHVRPELSKQFAVLFSETTRTNQNSNPLIPPKPSQPGTATNQPTDVRAISAARATPPSVWSRRIATLRQKFQHLTHPNNTQFHEKLLTASADNNIERIRTLCAQRPEALFIPKYGNYDHFSIIAIMDDDGRVNRAMKQYPAGYKADLCLWSKGGTHQDYSVEDHLIKSNKKLTPNSKLIISGHGPHMANMTGREFAQRLDQWLARNKCLNKDTPRITLASCKSGRDNPGGGNFSAEMSAELFRIGRKTEITCTTEPLIIFPDGKEVCYAGENRNGIREVDYWQGADDWLNPKLQQKHGFLGMTSHNRVTDLIKVFTTDPAVGTIHQDKHDIQGAEGLHSIMPQARRK